MRDILRAAKIKKRLPADGGRRDKLPDGIEGATIIQIGELINKSSVEGGLVIDYTPLSTNEIRRVVLGFTELGMWIAAYFPNVLVT